MAADKTITTLQKIRSEDSFNGFWEKVVQFSSDKDVDDPVLPRRQKRPRSVEEGSASHEYDSCPKDMYRRIYYEALDLLIQAINTLNATRHLSGVV